MREHRLAHREPCPIPRCALEWHLAVLLIVVGTYVITYPDAISEGLAMRYAALAHYGWASWLILPGALQAASLCTFNQWLQRWAALLAAVAALILCLLLFFSPAPAVLAAVLLVITNSELYVFFMLRGARPWRSSSRSSSGSPGSGSPASPY